MELDLKKLFTILWQKAWIIITIFILGVVMLYLYSTYFLTPLYTSSATLYVTNNKERPTSAITTSDIVVSKELVNTCIVIIKSNSVLNKVVEKTALGYDPDDIRKMISAVRLPKRGWLRLPTHKQHAQILAATQIAPAEIVKIIKAGAVEVIDPANLPENKSPDVPKNSILAENVA